jgi:hypothetical protein
MTKNIRSLVLGLAAALVLPVASAAAQKAAPAFGKGAKILDLGIVTDPTGLGAGLAVGLLELAPNLTLGVGGTFAYQSESFLGVDVSSTWIAGVGNVHYTIPDLPALDLFGGAVLGIVRGSVSGGGESVSDSEVGFGLNLGARYMFTPKIGGVVRLGIEDVPDLFLGVSIKF